MVLTICRKWSLKARFFCQKAQHFVHFRQYTLVQIWPVCGPNTYQIMYVETLDLKWNHLQR